MRYRLGILGGLAIIGIVALALATGISGSGTVDELFVEGRAQLRCEEIPVVGPDFLAERLVLGREIDVHRVPRPPRIRSSPSAAHRRLLEERAARMGDEGMGGVCRSFNPRLRGSAPLSRTPSHRACRS